MSPRRWLLCLGLYAAATAFAACTYDWPVGRPSASDAGPDAPTDASLVDRLVPDAGDAAQDAPPPIDTGVDGAPSCAALQATAGQKRNVAKRCPAIGTQCFVKVTDECGCDTWVLDAGTPAVNDYLASVIAVKNQCTPSCGICAPLGVSGACILIDGGAAQACEP
jgi:hypothetical protein